MTEGAQEWRKGGNGGRMGMAQGWAWRKDGNGARMGMAQGWAWRKDGNGGGMGMAEGVEMVERADPGIDADRAPPASRAS